MSRPTFNLSTDELSRFNRDLIAFTAALDKDIETEVHVQGRLTLRDAINYTPPMQAGHGNTFQTVAPTTQRRQGEKAIENDLNRLYQALNSLDIIASPQSTKLAQQIRRHMRLREWEALGELIKAAGVWPGKGTPKILAEATRDHHKQWRTRSSGKVAGRIKQPFLVASAPSIAKRKREAKKAVGYAKSGWNKAARGLKLPVPNWVARHNGPGIFVREGRKHSFAVTLGNSVPYIQNRADRIRSRAIANRSNAMQRQMDHLATKRTRAANARK